MLTLPQLDQQLRDTIAPVYVLLGEERHLQRAALAQVQQALVRRTGQPVTPVRIDPATQSVGDLLAQVQGLDLFASHPLVVAAGIAHWPKESLAALAEYAAAPNRSATLILACDSLDQRTAAAKQLCARAVVVSCKPLYPNQVPDWIRMECTRQGKVVGQDTARLLAETLGTDLGTIAQAIEKLLLVAADQKVIDTPLVERVILERSLSDVFAFTAAVGQRDVGVAERRLAGLLTAGEPPVRLLAMLARHWRLLTRAREWLHSHPPDEQALARHLKVHPFFVREYASQARAFSPDRLTQGFTALAAADRQLKRTQRPAHEVFTQCLLQLVG